ncbi:Uncharacterized protein Adt_15066 [Abeliophyllum distichum]|uniref:Uncharacterized protein n=1 Tax=Abeliophyllum distichum TaxID=126358 RepID=A0ABD1U1F9_9LAMI
MRHPSDTIWKEFDKIFPNFLVEPRNIGLGHATNGFNPFEDMNKPCSMWPVVAVPYNLPPWMCMTEEFTMLTLLIPGKYEPGVKEITLVACCSLIFQSFKPSSLLQCSPREAVPVCGHLSGSRIY